jgi:hypothetical protein
MEDNVEMDLWIIVCDQHVYFRLIVVTNDSIESYIWDSVHTLVHKYIYIFVYEFFIMLTITSMATVKLYVTQNKFNVICYDSSDIQKWITNNSV